ncbi:hypothetical protein [Runella salmonicolor]|uniref:Uncharacterized protein n=1 Tax=Runella salmonicolor TaxID=2950278 RepID=A0ABT1FQ42_9BACT|nr:hypothetical protein [Runella salmonicolor]MCP1383888.1 hypothetical protein [Runella salmonicolor]
MAECRQSWASAYHFPKGVVTSSQKNIPFRNGMTATGEIVTEDLKLIERLFYDLRKVLRR